MRRFYRGEGDAARGDTILFAPFELFLRLPGGYSGIVHLFANSNGQEDFVLGRGWGFLYSRWAYYWLGVFDIGHRLGLFALARYSRLLDRGALWVGFYFDSFYSGDGSQTA